MSNDLPFNNDTINSHQDIPSLQYPTLPSVSLTNLVLTYNSQPIVDGVLPDNGSVSFANISIGWSFPLSDNLRSLVAVGWQLQVCEGFFTSEQAQSVVPPGTVDYEYIFNFNSLYPLPQTPYVDLSSSQTGSVAIPAGVLRPGTRYTARIRALVFSNLGLGTVDEQYFKYTDFGIFNFMVNSAPSATNLRVNGQPNPMGADPRKGIGLSFTFIDSDGPQYLYQVQIGTTPGPTFVPDVWDSGLVSAGTGYGNRDFMLAYSGPPLSPGVVYAWRVDVRDGLTDGGFTAAYDTFQIDYVPTVLSITINGQEAIDNGEITVSGTAPFMTWAFFAGTDTQHAYNLVVMQNGNEILNTGNVYSSASSLSLPDIPPGVAQATMTVMDSYFFGNPVTVEFNVGVPPQAVNVLIDGETNPGDVSSSAPTISWTFLGNNPGSMQTTFRLQVATDETFGTLLWDSGEIASADTSVIYGTTPSPLVGPWIPLHGTPLSVPDYPYIAASGYYYVRIWVSDQTSSVSPMAEAFFAINAVPYSPLLNAPMTGSFSGTLEVIVTPYIYPETLLYAYDPDDDPVTYTLEITSRRSSDNNWEYLAGPFDPSLLVYPDTFNYLVDLSSIKAGNDYGIRVVANDGFADSVPTFSSVSPLNAMGFGFTILNHPPNTPTMLMPAAGTTYSSLLVIEWLEANPVDIDDDTVFYLVEYTANANIPNAPYTSLGYFPEGTTRATLDTTTLPNGTFYQVRITASDDKGGIGVTNYSGIFTIDNSISVKDVETLGGTVYIGTSDGRILAGTSSAWQVNEDFDDASALNAFVNGKPSIQAQNGALSISTPQGTSYIVRI